MITRRPVTTTLAALGLATAARAAAAQAPGVAGSWTGVLSAGPAKLRLRLVLGADGTATLYSLDQGGAAMAGKANALAPEKIEVEIAAVGGRFAGKLVSADRIDGTWSQGGAGLPLTLKRGDAGHF